jgi:hypothetical protein
MLSVEFYYCYAECRYAECHSAKGRGAYPRPVQQDFSPWYSKLVRLLLSVLSTFARYFRKKGYKGTFKVSLSYILSLPILLVPSGGLIRTRDLRLGNLLFYH